MLRAALDRSGMWAALSIPRKAIAVTLAAGCPSIYGGLHLPQGAARGGAAASAPYGGRRRAR